MAKVTQIEIMKKSAQHKIGFYNCRYKASSELLISFIKLNLSTKCQIPPGTYLRTLVKTQNETKLFFIFFIPNHLTIFFHAYALDKYSNTKYK